MAVEATAATTTPLQRPKLFEPASESAAAAIAITSNASTSRTRSTMTVAPASPMPILARGAIAPIRNSSPSLNGQTAVSANPMAVTAVASPRVAARAGSPRRRRGARRPQDAAPALAADQDEGEVPRHPDRDPRRVRAAHRRQDLVGMDRAQQSIKDEHANGEQDGPLYDPAAVQLRLPVSRKTVRIARRISWREIFDWPRSRSVNVIGTSTSVRPARSQRASSSISAE